MTNRIEKGLSARGLRHLFGAIERNPATPGEYVLWPFGQPVRTVAEAVAFAQHVTECEQMLADAEEA